MVLHEGENHLRHGTILPWVIYQLFTWKKDVHNIAMHAEQSSKTHCPTHASMRGIYLAQDHPFILAISLGEEWIE